MDFLNSYTLRTGETRALNLQPRDFEMLRHIARFWTLTAHEIARAVTPTPEIWGHDRTPEQAHQAKNAEAIVTRRLGKIMRVSESTPLIRATRGRGEPRRYIVTSAGLELLGLDWRDSGKSPMTLSTHARAAESIAWQIEQETDLRVLTEREGRHLWDVRAEDDLEPLDWETSHAKKHGERAHSKLIPDLWIPLPSGKHLAIEIERTPKTREAYRKKLDSYHANPLTAAVWYISESKNVRDKVRAVNETIKGNHDPMPVVILGMKERGAEGICFQSLHSPKTHEIVLHQLTQFQRM